MNTWLHFYITLYTHNFISRFCIIGVFLFYEACLENKNTKAIKFLNIYFSGKVCTFVVCKQPESRSPPIHPFNVGFAIPQMHTSEKSCCNRITYVSRLSLIHI